MSSEDGWKVVKRKARKSSNCDKVFPRAPSGSLFKEKFLINPQSKVDLGSDDSVPKSKSGPGPVTVLRPVVSPGFNFGSGSVSGANARTDILESEMKRDPAFALAVSSLERCLKVRERFGSSLISGRPGKPSGSGGIDTAVRETDFKGSVSDAAPVEVVRRSGAVGGTAFRPISAGHGSACAVERALGKSSKLSSFENDGGLVDGVEGDVCSSLGRRGHSGAETVLAIAVENERINGLLEGSESDFSKNLADESADSPGRVRSSAAHATAGESKGIVGSFQPSESEFPSLNSSLGSLSSASARRFACSATAAAARVCPGSSSLAVSAAVARAHASTLHDACSNSWSDTVRVTGPTGTRRVKGGVSGPAEDLRPVSEVEAGVNFRPAGSVRGQVTWFTSQEATRHRYQAGQGKCGHTSPPPGGSWYPIRVTWIRIGHQAINGLDEGVWNRTVGDLGARG